jgi:hypothetical protein
MPTIHEADLESGPSGAVLRGAEIDFNAAVARRVAGGHVVVCGSDLKENRALARQIEAAVGPYSQGTPHTRTAGPLALPHFQQLDQDNEGHTFYDTPNRYARKKP